MPIIEFPGTPAAYNAGQNSGNYLAKAADAAADFACSLHKSFPGAVIGNPLDSYRRGLYDSLCGGRPGGLPAPPQSQLPGTYCRCQGYGIDILFTDPTSTEPPSVTEIAVSAPLYGIIVNTNTGVPGVSTWYFRASVCVNGVPTVADTFLGNVPSDAFFTIQSIEPLGEGCSDAEPSVPLYPPDSYFLPPNGNSGSGNIEYNDGTDFTVPVGWFNISPQFSFDPRFNIDVGGVDFQFNLGGVKIDLGNGNANPALPRDRFNDPSDDFDRLPPNNDGGGEPPSNQPPPPPEAPPPDEDPDLEQEPKSEDDPKEESGVARLKWVKIILTELPDKMHYGDGAPNCYFAGWFEFKSGASCYERMQINFTNNLFLAPPGADGYAYTLTNGAKGYAIVYKAKG